MKKLIRKLKGAWRSKTIWFNAAFLAMLPVYNEFLAQLPLLKPYLPANVYEHVGLAVVIINILMRFRTSTSLEHK